MPAQPTGDLQTLLTSAAFAPIADRASLRITGSDATRWLNGMVTNSIQALTPGEGNYNFLLNAQGRIQGDCTIYREPLTPPSQTQNSQLNGPSPTDPDPSYLLQTTPDQLAAVQQLLDRFIIMDDVELTPLDTYAHGLHLLGPGAPAILDRISPALTSAPLQLHFLANSSTILTTPAASPVPSFFLASETPLDQAMQTARDAGALEVAPATLEQLRILEARPRYGTDIRNTDAAKDLPQETNQLQALHFAKGCYVGQEIVERIRSRGQVHRQFTPFRLDGPLPQNFPTPLEANGKPAGELTSAITIPTTEGDLHLALGYARREFLETKASITYPGGTAHPRSPGSLT